MFDLVDGLDLLVYTDTTKCSLKKIESVFGGKDKVKTFVCVKIIRWKYTKGPLKWAANPEQALLQQQVHTKNDTDENRKFERF